MQFQFQYGAIGGCPCASSCNIYNCISIPVWCDWWRTPEQKAALIQYFNSSMVRLVGFKPRLQCGGNCISIPVWCDWWHKPVASLRGLKAFQFQYGAIGGRFRAPQTSWSGISIPVWCDWWPFPYIPVRVLVDFNSSMVRLVAVVSRICRIECKFQFQYGAIGGHTARQPLPCGRCISIPVWCDWWKKVWLLRRKMSQISIPVWCDWWDVCRYQVGASTLFQFQYGAIGGHYFRRSHVN